MKRINFIWIIISSVIVLVSEFLFSFIFALILSSIGGTFSNDMDAILITALIGSIVGNFSGTFIASYLFKELRLTEPLIGASLIIIATRGFLMSWEIVLGTAIAISISAAAAFLGLYVKKRRLKKVNSSDDGAQNNY